MDAFYFAKITQPKLGLCHQLVNLISSIIVARDENKRIIVVDKFSIDSYKEDFCPISAIINLDKLNGFLKKYGVKVFDKEVIRIDLRNIVYGAPNRDKIVTKEILDMFCLDDNIITIDKEDFLNPIIGDPCIGITKRLLINYAITHKTDVELFTVNVQEFAGYLKENIHLDFNIIQTANYVYNSFNINDLNEVQKKFFHDILENIFFSDKFYNVCNVLLKDIDSNEKISAIHLRLEDDSVEKWCDNQDKSQYMDKLEKKYIGLIEKHLNKSEQIIVLSYSTNNSVIDFLKNNEYNFLINEKQLELGSDINAAFDFLSGTICNNKFIGNYNMEKHTGSLFSYLLSKRINTPVTSILVDLENLDNVEVIIKSTK